MYSPADELDAAIDQSEALNTLLANEFMSPQDGPPCERIQSGIVELSHHTFSRLRRANVVLSKAARVKGGV